MHPLDKQHFRLSTNWVLLHPQKYKLWRLVSCSMCPKPAVLIMYSCVSVNEIEVIVDYINTFYIGNIRTIFYRSCTRYCNNLIVPHYLIMSGAPPLDSYCQTSACHTLSTNWPMGSLDSMLIMHLLLFDIILI